jgi:parallel beta-helix repeat protein
MKKVVDKRVMPFVVGVLALAVIFSAFSDDSSLSGYVLKTRTLGPGSYNVALAGPSGNIQEQPVPHPKCGDIITQDTKLRKDLVDCVGHGLIIGANNILLDCNGYTIDGDQVNYDAGISIGSNFNKNITILNCKITEFSNGIHLEYATYLKLENNILKDNDFSGVYIESGSNNNLKNNVFNSNGYGLDLRSLKYSKIISNRFEKNDKGIYMAVSNENEIFDNTFFLNKDEAVYLTMSNDNVLNNNLANSNERGFSLFESDNNVLSNNLLNKNLDNHKGEGIILSLSNNNLLRNNTVNENSRFGILLLNSSYNTLDKNTANYNLFGTLYRNAGIALINSSNNLLIDNAMEDNDMDGLVLCGWSCYNGGSGNDDNLNGFNNILLNNKIRYNVFGGIIFDTINTTFNDNIVESNEYGGISLGSSPNAIVRNNLIRENWGLGFYIGHHDYTVFVNNTLEKNHGDGLRIAHSRYNVISDNVIRFQLFDSADQGIYLWNASYNLLWNNVFVNNSINAFEYNMQNPNLWNKSNVGNYWSDFSSNSGYPNYYKIPGYGDGIDWHPQ